METLILDPTDVAIDRTEWDITQYVAEAGPDFGDAQIEQYLADAAQGSLSVDYRIPNRTVTIPLLLLSSRSGTPYTFEQVRTRFQQKAALFQQEGGWISRSTSVGTVYADVIGATLKFGGSTAQALWGIDADAVLTLTCLPDWYGDEIDAGTYTGEVDSTELIFVLSNIKGDYPARTRMKVDELDGVQQRGLLWSFRSRHYSAAATAAPVYSADALTQYTYTGAIDDFGWRSILSTDLAAGPTSLTHVGSYRVWARIEAPLADGCQIRFVWDVGDLVLGVENKPVEILPLDDYWLVSLGDVHLYPAPIGIHRWRGMIQVKNIIWNQFSNAYEKVNIPIDKIWFQPIEESAGYIAAPLNTAVNLTGYASHDEFEQTAGNLTGKAPVRDANGATWASKAGSDSDDFTVDTTNHRVLRAAVSDAAPRAVYLTGGTNSVLTNAVAKVDAYLPSGMATAATQHVMLIFRYVNASNYAYIDVNWQQSPTAGVAIAYYVQLITVLGGVPTQVKFVQDTFVGVSLHNPIGVWSTLRVMVTQAGNVAVWWYPQGAGLPEIPTMVCTTEAATFATGSPLTAGYLGFGDYYTGAGAVSRFYDNFATWVPDADAILFANGTAELRSDGHFRTMADGVSYGPASYVVGDLPRLPVAGMEGRSTQVLLKPTSSDLNWVPDFKASKIKAQVLYRPCFLFTPGDSS